MEEMSVLRNLLEVEVKVGYLAWAVDTVTMVQIIVFYWTFGIHNLSDLIIGNIDYWPNCHEYLVPTLQTISKSAAKEVLSRFH